MIHGICLIRNEAGNDRWLAQYYQQMHKICDRIVFLDDHSDDNTVEVIKELHRKNTEDSDRAVELEIIHNEFCLWEVNELIARKKL